MPPTNGDYVFFVNSDDDSDLFLRTAMVRARQDAPLSLSKPVGATRSNG